MTDIFFSYSSKDRDRVRPMRDALVALGFDVFWDQTVPAGTDWDRWIRQHLNDAKCAMVFWSVHSVASDNVRHEAAVAKQHGKFVPVLLDTLTAEQFPMGLYATQAVNLATWTGDTSDGEWEKLLREAETRLTPIWVRRMVDGLEAELVSERARRESAERRDKTLRNQIAKEADARQELQRELEHAREEIDALKVRLQAAIAPPPVREIPARPPQPPQGQEPAAALVAPTPERPSRVIEPADRQLEQHKAIARGWFGLSARTMLVIACGLATITVVLLPVGISATGALLLLVPAGILLVGAVSFMKSERASAIPATDAHPPAQLQ